MLTKGKDVIRSVAESAGLIAPSLQDAEKVAAKHREALVAADGALERADQELQGAHDRGARDTEITRLEAAKAAAKAERDRAEGRYLGAERRAATARGAEAEQAKAAAVARRDAALATRDRAAAEIDRLAAAMAEQCRVFDGELPALSEAAAAGVAARIQYRDGATMARNALERAGALPSGWLGDKAEQPGAVKLHQQERGAILAVAA